MSEFFLELFSEEMPAVLQKSARENLLKLFKENFEKKDFSYKILIHRMFFKTY